MVESGSLENCCAFTGTVGSNPTLSAISILLIIFHGEVQEWLNWQHWKCCEPVKGSVGSNPTLSASFDCGLRVAECGLKNPKSTIRNPQSICGFRLRTRTVL